MIWLACSKKNHGCLILFTSGLGVCLVWYRISLFFYVFFETIVDRRRVLLSDWSILKMNITNLALDQSECSTES